jgi:hypothetical protein
VCVTSTRLAALAIKLMGARDAEGEITDPVDYCDGLMIALLAQRPLHLRTFSLIRVGTHLRQVGEERRMIFEGPGSESDRPFEITVPDKLVPPLEYYLQDVRPKFTGADRNDRIWDSTKGRPLPPMLSPGSSRAKPRRLRGPVNPHRFRHCAGGQVGNPMQSNKASLPRQKRKVPARIGPLIWTLKPNLPSLPVILKLRLR